MLASRMSTVWQGLTTADDSLCCLPSFFAVIKRTTAVVIVGWSASKEVLMLAMKLFVKFFKDFTAFYWYFHLLTTSVSP